METDIDNSSEKLRMEVLMASLTLEEEITKVLLSYLDITHENLNALGHKSMSLSFNSKLHLLRDIEVINTEEYNAFNMMAEIRNKFMHNINCKTMEFAIGEIKGFESKLLRTDDLGNEYEYSKEFRLCNAYRGNMLKCLDIIQVKHQQREIHIRNKISTVTTIIDHFRMIVDHDSELLDSIFNEIEKQILENKYNEALLKALDSIADLMVLKTNEFKESDDYKDSIEKVGENVNAEMVRKLLKR